MNSFQIVTRIGDIAICLFGRSSSPNWTLFSGVDLVRLLLYSGPARRARPTGFDALDATAYRSQSQIEVRLIMRANDAAIHFSAGNFCGAQFVKPVAGWGVQRSS